MHQSIGVKSEPKFKPLPSTNLLVHNYLKIIISNSIIQTLPTKEVTTYYLTSRLDHLSMDSTSGYMVLQKPILFKTSLNHTLTHLYLRLTYSLEEGCVSTTVYKDFSRKYGYLVDQ